MNFVMTMNKIQKDLLDRIAELEKYNKIDPLRHVYRVLLAEFKNLRDGKPMSTDWN